MNVPEAEILFCRSNLLIQFDLGTSTDEPIS